MLLTMLSATLAAILLAQSADASPEKKIETIYSMVVKGHIVWYNHGGSKEASVKQACKLAVKKVELLDKDGWHDEQACGKAHQGDAEGPEEITGEQLGANGDFLLAGYAWDPYHGVDAKNNMAEPLLRITLKGDFGKHECASNQIKTKMTTHADKIWNNKNVLRIAAPRKYSQLFTAWAGKDNFKSPKLAKDDNLDAKTKITGKKYHEAVKFYKKDGSDFPIAERETMVYNFGDINVNLIEFNNCKDSGCWLRKTQECKIGEAANTWETDIIKDNGQLEPSTIHAPEFFNPKFKDAKPLDDIAE